MQQKLQTLEVVSTLNEKDLKPYWNESCKDISSKLWLPTVIDLQEQDLNLSNGSSNQVEVVSNHWSKIVTMNDSTQKHSYHLSPASVRHFMGKEAEDESQVTQIVTKKIRIYPKNEDAYITACDLSRYSYNQCIESFKNYKTDLRKFSELRRDITTTTKNFDLYINHIVGEACATANNTRNALILKRKKGEKCDYKFKSKRDPRQGFDIQELPKNNIYPRSLGKVTFSEKIPDYAYGRSARVVFDYNEWYLCCQDKIEIKKFDFSKIRGCAIDPGVRTFVTTYSPICVGIYGDGFTSKLKPIQKKLDHAISERSKLFKTTDCEDKQWYKNKLKFYQTTITKCRIKARNIIENLHKQTASHITKNNDVILLPTFDVSKMVLKTKRLIGRQTVRNMLGLCHYKFEQVLKWQAKKRGKIVLDVNESYTSKTNTFTGELMNIGSAKTFIYQGKKYDRDVNAAKGIFIKHFN